MAFLNKLSEIAKNVGEMTNDALENSRKNSQISAENKKIRQFKEEIGNYYFEKYQNGEPLDEPMTELCKQITASLEIITTLQRELEAADRQAAEQEKGGNKCPACGHINTEGTKFCSECGERLEGQSKKFCTECGAENTIGTKFCIECGTRLED